MCVHVAVLGYVNKQGLDECGYVHFVEDNCMGGHVIIV